jgi:hypothetical protein
MNASLAGLGTNRRPDSASVKTVDAASGTSSAVRRAGPRSASMISERSCALTQPAPYIRSSRVPVLMCATPYRSRRIFTREPRGVISRWVGPWPAVPKTFGLYNRLRSGIPTRPKSGVRPSYIAA